jgi:hypothetical protein
MDSNLIKLFSKNRAEEFAVDVWGEYVLPPNYEKINLFNYEKAVMIEGGRGSGKTMFLRYHCHDTRFSSNRDDVPLKELKKIGVYFRPDTHFCSSISSSLYGAEWEKIFSKYILINVIKEFYLLSKNITKCNFENNIKFSIEDAPLPPNLSERLGEQLNTFSDLGCFADLALASLNDWINDPDYFKRPIFPDTRSIINSLISTFQQISPEFSSTKFTLYIDEFENLTEEQQKLLNTWIKHGENNLIISVAYKKFGSITSDTMGSEKLVLRNDYRKIDLEEFSDDDFYNFAAEILILKLDGHIEDKELLNYKAMLCEEKSLSKRANEEYSNELIKLAKHFLPSISYNQIATEIFNDQTLKKRLQDFLIKPALTNFKYTPNDFLNEEFPVESIINGILLNRSSQKPDDIFANFQKLITEKTNKYYSPYKDLLVGGILWIYISAGRKVIPIYSGFERICIMAKFNLRHFLEFCHQCLVEYKKDSTSPNRDFFQIPINVQAIAARKNSELEVEKVVELGRYGNNLRFIVNRLGLFFQLLQKRKAQSEPEIAHFSIDVVAIEQLPENLKLLLEQLKIWSVIIEFSGDTKRKSHLSFTSYEYMLHPMLAPNFSITFRKIRKHIFSVADLNTIFCGTEEEFLSFCAPYISKLSENKKFNSAQAIQGSLFDEV